jgi:phosphate transport system substrate-binding protein
MFPSKAALVLIALIALAMIISACGGSAAPVNTPAAAAATNTPVIQTVVEKLITATPGPQPTSGPQAGSITINGAGATFPFPLYSRWFYDYAFVDPAVKFNYQSIGSGGGIAQITAKTVDFGASDAILNDDQLSKAPGVQMFPSVAGAEVLAYNLKGDDGNVISSTIKIPYTGIADIFLGKIKKWNDPVLAQANPNLKMPAKDILVVHRSDGSGTTYIFTDYLSKVSPEWKSQVGNATSVKWPTGLGGKGNEGVSGTVVQNDGAIGYVELAYALQNKLPYGIPQNKAGEYVDPGKGPEGVQSAMADFGTGLGDKLAISIVDALAKGSYPISGYTYLLIYMDQKDCTKAQKIVNFVKWAQTDVQGQKDAKDLLYIPLPDAVKSQVLDKLGKITCQGKPLQ